MFVIDSGLGGGASPLLLTVNVAAGAVSSALLPATVGLQFLEYDPVAGTLIGGLQGGSIVNLDPQTGAITPLAGLTPAGAFVIRKVSAIDPASNRVYMLNGPQLSSLATIDTLTGQVLSNVTLSNPFMVYASINFDSVTNQLYTVATLLPGWLNTTLAVIDPVTGVVTPLSTVGVPPATSPQYIGATASTIDEQRGLYHFVASSAAVAPVILYTFDLATGNVVADPPITQPQYGIIAVDASGPPVRGRTTPFPDNRLVPGGTRTLVFDSLAHAGQFYVPFVSSSPGTFQVPGSNLSLPLAFDVCSDLYFNSPASPAFFNLVPGGGLAGILPATGAASGTVTLPVLTPAGLGFDLLVSFLTLDTNLQWTAAHGVAVIHVTS